jgi:hypothetical protein
MPDHGAALFHLSPDRALTPAKLLPVPFPVALNGRQDALVLGIGAQLTPVFVALEPRIIVVAEFVGAAQPCERMNLRKS